MDGRIVHIAPTGTLGENAIATARACLPVLGLLLLLPGTPAVAASPPPGFSVPPSATRGSDGTVTIRFTVNRATDVTVCVEDLQGRPIRHLASGVLGENPPEPFKPGLAQSIEWDGLGDWKKPAPPGSYKVRVMLGLSVRYDREVVVDPISIGEIQAIAVGPGGTLYAVVRAGTSGPNWPSQRLVALNRNGTYQRTLIPPPANATSEQIRALGGVPVEVGGRTVPMVVHVNQRRNTAFQMRSSAGQIDVTPGGSLMVLAGESIGLVDTTNAANPPPFVSPRPYPAAPEATFRALDPYVPRKSYLASSGDGAYAYFSGLAPKATPYCNKNRVTPPYPAIFRVKLPERTPAEPFFGDLEKTGAGETLLGGPPAGMASDGKGHLLVCDPANGRVVIVAEADGNFAGANSAPGAELVAVNRASGEVYLLKPHDDASAELVKLSGWKNPKPVASATLSSTVWPKRRVEWHLAADAGAAPAVLWVAADASPLRLIEDRGASFGEAREITRAAVGDGGFVGLTVDHFRADPEVYARVSGSGYHIGFVRYNERSDTTERLQIDTVSTAAGSLIEPGPDGNLYVQGWPAQLYKFDRNARPLAWEKPNEPLNAKGERDEHAAKNLPKHALFSRVIMVYMTHTLGIRGDGHLFVFEGHPTEGKNGTHGLFEYLPSGEGGPGQGGNPVVWRASDSVVGPRFDQQGNLYVAEQIRPANELIPQEFREVTGPVTLKSGWPEDDPRSAIAQMYGSIVKFGPKGGCIDIQFYRPRADEPAPNPVWKSIDAASWIGQIHNHFSPNKVSGALWMHSGISQINLHYCNCENTRFDVDLYGRVWYPDLGRYRVGVLDTNGNPVMTFGSYGNGDSRGPESKDPTLAEPEIAFAWLIGVGATDKYAYMGDSLNRRLLRAKLVYRAEATCDVK